ncbi:hypothetical protein, partial [Klebsiella aerogenes]|uniref:hypothetical protein n=1 Tax=Klebsiella aerogenes TaxID=548 RepID=UPI0019536DDF
RRALPSHLLEVADCAVGVLQQADGAAHCVDDDAADQQLVPVLVHVEHQEDADDDVGAGSHG